MSLSAQQLAIRRGGLTASDMRAIVGIDPYGRTPHDVYADKVTGGKEGKTSERMEIGNELEPLMIRLLARRTGLHVLRQDPETLTRRHRINSAWIATPDCFFSESAFHEPIANGEVKAPGPHGFAEWGDPGTDHVPDWVMVQTTWQLVVTELPVCHVGALLGTEFRHYRVDRDDDLAGVLCEEADKFWRDHITPGKPPRVDGGAGCSRMQKAIYARTNGTMIRACEETELRARAYFKAKTEATRADIALEIAKQDMVAICGENGGILGEGWRLKRSVRKGYRVEAHDVGETRTFDMREVKTNARKPSEGRAA